MLQQVCYVLLSNAQHVARCLAPHVLCALGLEETLQNAAKQYTVEFVLCQLCSSYAVLGQ